MIPLFKPNMRTEEILKELRPVFDSGWIGLGPKTKHFEEEFAKFVGAKHAVAVNSCTAALHLAIKALGIGEGDEVLVPAMTFVSTALVLLYEKAVPVFVDCDPVTLNIDLGDAARKITSRTKAAIIVHYGGRLVDAQVVDEQGASFWKKVTGLKLIEDCAHATGTVGAGQYGDVSCWSFHAVKNLPIGDGGMVTTYNRAIADKVRKLRWLGIDKTTWERADSSYAWRYSIDELGFKYHMNDVMATIGLVQLKYVKEDNEARRKIADRYSNKLDSKFIETPPVDKGCSWHNYTVKVKPPINRDKLIKHLAHRGITAGVHYEPIVDHKVFKGLCKDNHLVDTRLVWFKLVTLPMYPTLSEVDQDYVIEEINEYVKAHG